MSGGVGCGIVLNFGGSFLGLMVFLIYLGGMMDPEMSCDILLAPETEFKFISQEDEHTMIWKCVNQKFYD